RGYAAVRAGASKVIFATIGKCIRRPLTQRKSAGDQESNNVMFESIGKYVPDVQTTRVPNGTISQEETSMQSKSINSTNRDLLAWKKADTWKTGGASTSTGNPPASARSFRPSPMTHSDGTGNGP